MKEDGYAPRAAKETPASRPWEALWHNHEGGSSETLPRYCFTQIPQPVQHPMNDEQFQRFMSEIRRIRICAVVLAAVAVVWFLCSLLGIRF